MSNCLSKFDEDSCIFFTDEYGGNMGIRRFESVGTIPYKQNEIQTPIMDRFPPQAAELVVEKFFGFRLGKGSKLLGTLRL